MRALTRAQRVLFALAGGCLAASAVFQFCMVGYLMTALLFLGAAACLVFFGILAPKTTAARRLRIAMVIFLIIGICLFLIAEVPVLRDARSDADTDAPYLLVCGAGINGTAPSLSMLDRLRGALTWLEEHPSGVAVLSGSQAPDEVTAEALVMYDWLTAQGVDPARLVTETEADNSFENIQNTLAIIAQHGDDPAGRLAILSSEYHLHRLKYMAEKLGCDPVLVAARTTKASLFVNYAVREAFAMWKLWLFGM